MRQWSGHLRVCQIGLHSRSTSDEADVNSQATPRHAAFRRGRAASSPQIWSRDGPMLDQHTAKFRRIRPPTLVEIGPSLGGIGSSWPDVSARCV